MVVNYLKGVEIDFHESIFRNSITVCCERRGYKIIVGERITGYVFRFIMFLYLGVER